MADNQSGSIDMDFVAKMEGGNQPTAYILPVDQFPKGGVLVGIGVDLGQHNPKSLGISDRLRKKLRGYFGLKGKEAKRFLESNPITLNENELAELNRAVFSDIKNKVISTYESLDPVVPWKDLSTEQRTVIFDVGYQFGPYFRRKDKEPMNFILHAARNDWEAVDAELADFGDAPAFQGRRNAERNLLRPPPKESQIPPEAVNVFERQRHQINPNNRAMMAGVLSNG